MWLLPWKGSPCLPKYSWQRFNFVEKKEAKIPTLSLIQWFSKWNWRIRCLSFKFLEFSFVLLTDILKTVRGVWGISLVFQWLGLPASTAGGTGLVPCWGTINKIPQAARHGGKKNEESVDFIAWLTLWKHFIINIIAKLLTFALNIKAWGATRSWRLTLGRNLKDRWCTHFDYKLQ